MSVAGGFRSRARWLLLRCALDATHTAPHRSALVIAPHPDDETIGCGGRILLGRRAGRSVTVTVVGDGAGSHRNSGGSPDDLRMRRRAELDAACELLGIARGQLHALGYPDDAMAGHVDEIARDLEQLVRTARPDDVYVTCADERHPDHAAVAVAARRAIERVRPSPRLLEYPIWLWSDWPLSRRFRDGSGLRRFCSIAANRSIEVVRLDAVRSDKQRALASYRSQLGDADLPEDLHNYTSPRGKVALPTDLVRRAIAGPELFFTVPTGR